MRQALITGTSSGIGLAIARCLLERNEELEVVGLSRRPGPLEGSPRFSHWPTDLTDLAAVTSRARRFRQELGACDLLACAAGTGGFAPTDAWDAASLQSLVALNLTSPMLLCSEILPALRDAGRSLVVLVGSTSSRERAPVGAAYAATKAGLQRFAESLFAETRKQGVRVLHLCPGMTNTPFYDTERFAPDPSPQTSLAPPDLAELVHFFFTGPGQNINPTHLVLEPQRVGIVKTMRRD